MLQFKTLSSLHQQGADLREFALRFSITAEGLDFNDAALKDLFNYALDEPLNWWRMRGLDHLTFVGFIDFLARQGNPPAEEAAAPPVVAEHAAASPSGGRQNCSSPKGGRQSCSFPKGGRRCRSSPSGG